MSLRGKANELPKKYSLNSQLNNPTITPKKMSSFDHENSEDHDNGNNNAYEIKPLSTKFYSNLLRLEEKVSTRNFDIETLNEIVSIYAVSIFLY